MLSEFDNVLILKAGMRIGYEIKYSDAPKTTKSMSIAIKDLKLNKLHIIYPGKKSYMLSEKITACTLNELVKII